MNTDERRRLTLQIASHECHGFFLRSFACKAMDCEFAHRVGSAAWATCFSALELVGLFLVRDFGVMELLSITGHPESFLYIAGRIG